ncbi:hypothetical protein [Halobacillus karajensis]|uniref:Uncharacterized protein n=1 Tax=Halobacillus karajensis TaxID=195088 RepID=A0A024P8R1_9BACI|nr:hypothetical protein [Halobacillus karajensis]CDQ21234.1 hypothetical protein BN982_03600 [Halobacillus karajensis]CDQ25310.1 hypothetical protein BN983_03628 [Halobacillus karajensis]CDQ25967.1 hypothetical protein BN981_00174 [Halobacillus karajensis]
MNRKKIFLICGAILFISSVPLGPKMLVELIHASLMESRYKLTSFNNDYPSREPYFEYANHSIKIDEELKNKDTFVDPWEHRTAIGNLALIVDGEVKDLLKKYPVRVEQSGLSRYWGDIAFIKMADIKKNKKSLVVVLKKTQEIQKELPNGDITGGASSNELEYTTYTFGPEGSINRDDFRLTQRNALQTKILNAGVVGPHRLGFYTNAWQGYPTIFFPFMYPLLPMILGFIIILVTLVKLKREKYQGR